MDFQSIEHRHQQLLSLVTEWSNKIYDDKFSKYFELQTSLYERLHSDTNKITDAELEQILTDIPLDLFSASEDLNSLRLSYEVLKIEVKTEEAKFRRYIDNVSIDDYDNAIEHIDEDKALIKIYESIITCVENQISFTRELIMGAKKLWDARRQTERVNPVKEVNPDIANLPEYDMSDINF